MKKYLIFAFLVGHSALAAQIGKIVVDEASVYEFPQRSAKVVGKLPKGAEQTVSNLPTDGFFKTKLSTGDIGWISGNDILVGTGGAPASSKPKAPGAKRREIVSEDEISPNRFKADKYRIQLGYGFQNLAYGGLSSQFQKTVDLNYGKSFGIEIQRMISESLHWAFRAEMYSSKTGTQDLGSSTTQTLEQYSIPIQLGLIYSPIYSKRFRLGLGAYFGVAPVSYTTVSQTTTTDTNTIKFNSMDPVGTASVQAVYGLGRAFGVLGEMAYHYQTTGSLPATTVLGSIPSFKINYSGWQMRLGLEIRF